MPPARHGPCVVTDRADWLAQARADWDGRADRWDIAAERNAAAPDRAAELDRVWQALALRPGARVLDVGCGSGQWAVALARRGGEVTGVDLSPAMVARAERHAAEAGVAVRWHVGEAARVAGPDAAYDAVLARVVLQLVPDVPAALAEFRRVLRPGGRLLASVPGALSPIYGTSWQRHLPGAPRPVNHLLPWELEALLADGGWRVRDGWGEFGAELHGTANPLAEFGPGLARALRQAAATTWSVVAE